MLVQGQLIRAGFRCGACILDRADALPYEFERKRGCVRANLRLKAIYVAAASEGILTCGILQLPILIIRLFFCLECHKKRVVYLIDLLVFVSVLTTAVQHLHSGPLSLILLFIYLFLHFADTKITVSPSFFVVTSAVMRCSLPTIRFHHLAADPVELGQLPTTLFSLFPFRQTLWPSGRH